MRVPACQRRNESGEMATWKGSLSEGVNHASAVRPHFNPPLRNFKPPVFHDFRAPAHTRQDANSGRDSQRHGFRVITPSNDRASALQRCIRTEKPFRFEQSGEFPQVPTKSRKPPEPTRAPRRVATHPDAHAARSAPRVLVPAGGRGSCLALSVGSLAWSLRYFLRPPCSPP